MQISAICPDTVYAAHAITVIIFAEEAHSIVFYPGTGTRRIYSADAELYRRALDRFRNVKGWYLYRKVESFLSAINRKQRYKFDW